MRTLDPNARTPRSPSGHVPVRWAVSLFFALGLVACATDDPTGPTETTIADLAGTWTSTGFSVTAKADPTVKVDLVALGGSLSWAVQPSGTFSGTAVIPGAGLGLPGVITLPVSGALRLQNATTLQVEFIPEIPPMFGTFVGSFVLSGDVLTIQDDDETDYDFDGDGQMEPATLQASFQRR